MSSHPLRVGVVGAGFIASPHVASWTALGAQVHIYSVNGASALAQRFGCRVVSSLEACIEEADLVDVCTPTFTHDEIVLAAAAAGRHVVCEKPLSRDHERAARLVAACRDAGVALFPAHVVRYFPEYEAAQRMVADGVIGQVATMRLTRTTAMPTAAWFSEWDLSGGMVIDQMIHDFDFARWVAGDVVEVFARTTAGSAPITTHAMLRHKSGAITQVTGCWGLPRTAFRTTYKIRGTLGGLDHDSAARTPLTWECGDGDAMAGGDLLPDFDPADSPYQRELVDFVRSLRDGTAPRVSAEDSLAALDIALAAAASCRHGRPVDPKEVQA